MLIIWKRTEVITVLSVENWTKVCIEYKGNIKLELVKKKLRWLQKEWRQSIKEEMNWNVE